MKHIVWAVIAAAFIFTATESYARGFSVGVFGAYSIDGGNIEDSIKEKRYQAYDPGYPYITKSEYDTVIIPGAGGFAMYQFSNGFFLRAGAEIYQLVSGQDVSSSTYVYSPNTNGMVNYDYSFDYTAIAWPVLFGFSLSPDKGRTSLYMAAGVVTSLVKIKRDTDILNTSGPTSVVYNSENDTIISGFAGLIGAEKKIFWNISIMIEYAFYRCEENRKETGEYSIALGPTNEYQYTETYGLPRQQARIGVKYSF